jgi:hypothetical protein
MTWSLQQMTWTLQQMTWSLQQMTWSLQQMTWTLQQLIQALLRIIWPQVAQLESLCSFPNLALISKNHSQLTLVDFSGSAPIIE